ncbi:MAG: T9SS type A sorting domain-containing protein, partial [Bacteroidota bacterium]
ETSRRDVSTGESWETVARLDGAGTTDEPQSYRFEDADLPYAADSLSYRLRQVDTDGTESFSEAVTIARLVTEAELLPTYPNPARSTATVRFAVPERQDVRIHLYDMLGRRVQTVVDTGAEGRTEQVLDVSRLASGTYFLRMETEDGPVDTQRVTVVR